MSYTYIDDYLDDAAPIGIAQTPAGVIYRSSGKRLMDILIVLLAIPLVLPIVLLVWLLMYMNGGQGFFRQPRVGRDGCVFMCWKIRTMGLSAETTLSECIENDPVLAAEWRENQKLSNDPRITFMGKFLRRTSIDELPQFWNVLKGDMSLVGPRPFTPDQKKLYDLGGKTRAYYQLRPGISGLWQIKSRNAGSFRDRIGFDNDYEAQLSFWNDLRIILGTVAVVLKATGK